MGARDYFQIIRERRRERRFDSLFLFVTSRCNSLCRTCFYFDKLNSSDDLTLDQIARICATSPPFRKLWISGGEPVMRDELGEIVKMFVRRNGVRNLNLPTNGLLPKKIFRTIDYLLERCPDLAIDLNFSLDGLASTHDAIRRVPNNFQKTLETIEQAGERYEGVRRLRRNVLTVITSENYHELLDLARLLISQDRLGAHREEHNHCETTEHDARHP
ncbi:MAG: radical SAM protein, partial [Terriglobales bacterium]